jgi:carboxymethylenebutenolidase
MKREKITLSVADGTKMDAFVVYPEGPGPHPGIMVFQEAFGVNSHIRNIAERLAGQGYIAIAPELFHRTAPGFEGSYTDFSSVMPHMQAINTEGLEKDIRASYDWLAVNTSVKSDKIGSIGFCMGGRVSFLANIILPLAASVSYYSGSMPALADRLHEIHAPHLMFWGGLDKHILPEHIQLVVESLQKAQKTFINVVISFADHGFNCDERASYNPQAAKEAWALTLSFFENRLR